ncbi:MAG: biotin--[acetyl-CoA-carboxylase] ligase [Robiginitomaculum sp.]|nr:biotin--[acetyl-CoA-carboxylase] ligase [Robiginitomaculum sp.]
MVEPTAIRHFSEIDSTNSECLRLAGSDCELPLWVLADYQTNGRGRLSRSWLGQKGNLYASGLYSFTAPPAKLAELGFAAALAVIDTIAPFVANEQLSLKWPNDVLINGAKLCGILLESHASKQQGQNILVIGIGINLSHAPKIQDRKTVCLADFSKAEQPVKPQDLLPGLIENFEKRVKLWQEQGFAPLRQAWLANCHGLGETIRTSQGQIGIFEDMLQNGALLLRKTDGKAIEISAGEIFLSGQEEQS